MLSLSIKCRAPKRMRNVTLRMRSVTLRIRNVTLTLAIIAFNTHCKATFIRA